MSAFFDKATRKASAFGSKLNKSLSDIDAKVSKVTGAIKGIGVAAAVAGGGLVYLGGTGVDFEQTIANIRAVSGATEEQLASMGQTALKTGADMGFSGVEVARSMEAMSKQGLNAEQVLEGVGGVAAAASADGSSLDDTMGGLLSTMAGLGAGAKDLQHIADVMAKAGDSTAASIGTLSESMSVFAPTARALKIPVEDAVGQLALLQDAGLDASSAGTTLSAVYSKLSAPMGRTKKALAKLGLSVKDATTGDMKKPADLLNEIFGKVAKIKGTVGKAGILTELVGLESQKALLNLVGSLEEGADGTSKFARIMGDLENGVDGYSKKIAEVKMNTTAGDLKRLSGEAEALKIELFGLVREPLRDTISGVKDWTEANKGLIVQRVQDTLGWISEHQEGVVMGLKAIGIGAAVFITLAAVVKAASVATAAYELVVGAATVASEVFTFATNTERLSLIGSTVATWGRQAAQWAYNAALTVGAAGSARFTLAEIGGRVAQFASAAAAGVATAAKWAYAAATGGATVGLGAYATAAYASVGATLAAMAPLAPFLVTILAITAAIGALVLAWNQWNALDKDLEGSGGISGTRDKMKQMGGSWYNPADWFEAHDAVMNDKAKEEARKRQAAKPQVVTPADRVAKSVTETNSTSTERAVVDINAPTGAKVTKKPGALTTIKTKRTGAL